jgi:hypothetical protein
MVTRSAFAAIHPVVVFGFLFSLVGFKPCYFVWGLLVQERFLQRAMEKVGVGQLSHDLVAPKIMVWPTAYPVEQIIPNHS